MFNKLKEKLKNWIKKSKKDIEKKAQKIDKTPKKEKELEKEIKKLEKQVKKTKKEIIKETPKETKGKLKPSNLLLSKNELNNKSELGVKETEGVLGKGTAIEIEQEIKQKVPQEQIDEDLKEIEKPTKKSLFTKIKSTFSYKISEQDFNKIFEDLETLLLENNVALEVVEDIQKKLSEKLIDKEINKQDLEAEIKQELKNTLNEILIEPDNPLEIIKESGKKPFIILFFGINGTGKTTSIAKLTHLLQKNNLSVVLAAADTFRAASIEQIQIHADKLKVPLIKHDYGTDPSAVGFDAIKYAEKHKTDVVLIDTAGRMHTKTNLLAEMQKICRVTNPDLKIFVAESIAGNDAIEQAKTFNQMIEIDGSILSKADIDDKGGTIISISHAIHKPIFYLGIGQGYEDLQLFDKQKFISDLGL